MDPWTHRSKTSLHISTFGLVTWSITLPTPVHQTRNEIFLLLRHREVDEFSQNDGPWATRASAPAAQRESETVLLSLRGAARLVKGHVGGADRARGAGCWAGARVMAAERAEMRSVLAGS